MRVAEPVHHIEESGSVLGVTDCRARQGPSSMGPDGRRGPRGVGMREGLRSGCVSIRPLAQVNEGSGPARELVASSDPPTARQGLPSSEELDRAWLRGPGSPLAVRPDSPGGPHLPPTRTLSDEDEELDEQ